MNKVRRNRWTIAAIKAQGKVPICTKPGHPGPIESQMGPQGRDSNKVPDCCLGGKCSFLAPQEPDRKVEGLTDDEVEYWLQMFPEQDGP